MKSIVPLQTVTSGGGKPKKNGRPQIISPFQIWGQSHFHVYGVPRKSCIDILEGPRPQAQQNKM